MLSVKKVLTNANNSVNMFIHDEHVFKMLDICDLKKVIRRIDSILTMQSMYNINIGGQK